MIGRGVKKVDMKSQGRATVYAPYLVQVLGVSDVRRAIVGEMKPKSRRVEHGRALGEIVNPFRNG